jgi:hypothetical protein
MKKPPYRIHDVIKFNEARKAALRLGLSPAQACEAGHLAVERSTSSPPRLRTTSVST